MKMAKANKADLETAMDLCSALESYVRDNRFPEAVRPDAHEWFDEDDGEHCREAMAHILELARSASLFRVVFGMTVLLDPRNKIVDPDADTLEHHPDTVAALAAVAAGEGPKS